MFQKDFKPVLRFFVVSDVHYPDEHSIEYDRMKRAIELAYEEAEKSDYKKIDALYVVGDFATSGTEKQMLNFKKTLDEGIREGTEVTLMIASHEFHCEGGEPVALERFSRIFNCEPDAHKVINGFHFISETTTRGCNFDDAKIEYAAKELKAAREAAPDKPIFFFQHPHISDTVYGSINWGDDALYSTLMNYPQVIDFSGHSHAPINDPRSIHQKHFTSLGTGSLSYFELDEFDKHYGTLPPDKAQCAQMLFVEADAQNRVRIYPYDILTENFFPYVWEIDEPCNPKSFKYTDKRYKTDKAPYFTDDFKAEFSDITADGFTFTFTQAKSDEDYVNDYKVTVKEKATGLIVSQKVLWSGFYLYNMPEKLSVAFDGLKSATEYTVELCAGSFWKTVSDDVVLETATK